MPSTQQTHQPTTSTQYKDVLHSEGLIDLINPMESWSEFSSYMHTYSERVYSDCNDISRSHVRQDHGTLVDISFENSTYW